ncbi:hypothetical protein [Mesorhizobium sp.]|uniref:hypothetical protein n=1 Tax=Mesorhizobium sp. TaxID=1871066 RepID=UPI000FE920B2|nr:hypothetical protein [Mesorhizobium sp.]RWB65452.1 MAG: hypothetical protein EOQ49_32150 [Mesorhizobium sp.]
MHDLNIPAIADGQAADQWQTSNDGDAAIANALADILTVDFSGGDVTLTSTQFRSAMTFVPSGLSATRALTVPAVKRALFFVHNTDAGDSITVTRGSTTVSVAAGKIGAFYTDGTANGLVGTVLATGSSGVGSTASTTEVLTGTNTTNAVTPDALAALWEKGSDVASAATVSLGEGGYFHITGTTTITDIDWTTAKDGRPALVIFDGALTLTHNAATLKLPGNANITTAAGDRALFVQDASDNVICILYVRADGTPLLSTILRSDTTANLTKGFTATGYSAGTKSSGTFTPDPANGNLQYATNGGSHTLAPPSTGSGNALTMVIQYTNNGSAGAITTSSFTKVTGDTLTTTNGDDFLFHITVLNGFSHLNVVALQ